MTSYVILSVYRNDHPEHLALAVQSVLGSGRVLIGVDGPVSEALDQTLASVSTLPGVEVFCHAENRGLASVLNDLIDTALGDCDCELVFRMDADDISHPDRFARQEAFMREHPNVGVAGSWARTIDVRGRATGEITKSTVDRVLKRRLAYDSPFVHPSVVMRASVLRQGWRYPTHTIRFEDVALWARLARAGVTFSNVEEHLLEYRQTSSTTARRTGWKKSWGEFKVRALYVLQTMPWRMDSLALAFAILVSKVLLPPHSLNRLYAVRKGIFRF